ncbi:dihydrodipicolinate synthase family protein [Paenibacillus sp. N3.4]|uniref:dihydrodipicolinate synthase family protein n=1 Tax=Paenibacillus sp. N3.4 TaxID=2603222 RepID=UPI0011C9CB2E|nr:dihydrodipicolinate synthase family protein [Paenibacillus sp. N3.4]TXK77643.1 dihydrodipicolinate synthase family protein [Paenibacillus sp. N3.4]
MSTTMSSGVWPTMLTLFTDNNQLDEPNLERLVDWYIERGVHGLFAMCNSSEMFKLSLGERVQAIQIVVRQAAGRVPVIASGHISDRIEDQIEEIKQIWDTGIEAFVMLSNRLAEEHESDEVWKTNAGRILNAVPDVKFGIYECPYPYKRLMNSDLLQWCVSTGRFLFLKDTCCDIDEIRLRLEVLKESGLKLFNANSATLLESLKLGAAGYSGIMANHHPDLFVWLIENWNTRPEEADHLQDYLGLSSAIEGHYYPVDAKYNIQLSGVPLTLTTRVKDGTGLQPHQRLLVEQLKRYSDRLLAELKS